MEWPPLTASYERDVHARGMVFIAQLPSNTNLGASVAGAPGARTEPSPGHRAVYELAPLAVQLEMGYRRAGEKLDEIEGKAVLALDDAMTSVLETTGLDHGALGVAAKVLGIPASVLFIVLLLVLYLFLQAWLPMVTRS